MSHTQDNHQQGIRANSPNELFTIPIVNHTPTLFLTWEEEPTLQQGDDRVEGLSQVSYCVL